MTTWKHAAVIAAVLTCAVPAVSAKAPPKNHRHATAAVWDKEPTSFVGIDLGKPLPENFACPRIIRRWGVRSMPTPQQFCATTDEYLFNKYGGEFLGPGKTLRFYNGPDLGFAYSDWIDLQDGMVETIGLETENNHYGALKQLLFTRYGPPTSTSMVTWTLQDNGGQLLSEESFWTGKSVSIKLSEYSGQSRLGQWFSAVYVSDNKLVDAEQNENQASQENAASKL